MDRTISSSKSGLEQLVGQTFSRYQLITLLGQGGMGGVFRARDLTLQRDVAVKIMHPQFAEQPEFQERFLQEARTAAQLDHPGIVKVYDFGKQDSILYIVMEYLPGDNLRKLLETLKSQGKWIALPEAIQMVRQVCLAIDYAHRHEILHRDIKPDNIMLKPEPSEGLPYTPVVTDLGLAKLMEGGMMTQVGMSMGTPAYMSPEQALGETTDARSDIYSLGVLLYELTVGRVPFPAKTITEAIRYHTKEPVPPPRSIRSDLPENVERVILRAMEKEPAARFPSAQAMAQALATAPQPAPQAPEMTALGQQVSLVTVHQDSVGPSRGASVLQEFPEPAAGAAQDQISIMGPDKSVRTVALKRGGMTIGRDADNDVALDYARVSRHHAKITFNGLDYQVTDLNSTNGTFVGTFRLLPGLAETWTPDKPLRIGDCYIRLVRQAPGAGAASFGATMAGGTLARSSVAMGRVALSTETSQLTVIPGSSANISLNVLNQGPVVDSFTVSVEEIPNDWVKLPPPLLRLLPGTSQTVQLLVQPPRTPRSKAGSYLLIVKVTSQDAPDQSATMQIPLTVEPYLQFNTDLIPDKIRTGRPAQIVVNNQGNRSETFAVKWQDEADELAFSPAQTQIAVPEGKAGQVKFRANPKQRRIIGMDKNHPFSVVVSPKEGSAAQLPGQAVSGALIPLWVPPLLLMLCVGLTACLLFLIAKPPVITSFTYDPSNPIPGQPVRISWAVSGAQRIEFSPPVSNLDPTLGGFVFPNPDSVPKDLTLTATNMFGSVSRPLNFGFVQPTPTPTPEPGAPVIELWSVTPTTIGDGDVVTVRWKVSNADSVTVQPFGTVDNEGEMTDTPHQTKTYSIIASNKGKTVQRNQEVFVQLPPTPDVAGTLQAGNNQTAAAQQNVQAEQTKQAASQTKTAAAQQTKQANQTATAAVQMTQTAVASSAAATATAQAARYAQYDGNWANDDSNTSGITKLIISNSGPTISVHGYGKCSPTDCDWGTRSGTFTSEPFTILFDFGGGLTHKLTLYKEGSKLRVVDVGSSSGTHTYYFHQLFLIPPGRIQFITPSIISP